MSNSSSDVGENDLLGWAVIANVAVETLHGSGGENVQRRLRHFSPGTKVWVLPAQWGDGWEKAMVIGRHRGSKRFARIVVSLGHLEAFRVEGVYSPAVQRELTRPWEPERGSPLQWLSQAEAEEAIAGHPTTAGRLKSGS